MTSQGEGDQAVSMAELRQLWAQLKARGELWNGMTHHYLQERYGDRLYHVMGDGWYVRPERRRIGRESCAGSPVSAA